MCVFIHSSISCKCTFRFCVNSRSHTTTGIFSVVQEGKRETRVQSARNGNGVLCVAVFFFFFFFLHVCVCVNYSAEH